MLVMVGAAAVNCALDVPDAIVTDAGTVRLGLFEVRLRVVAEAAIDDSVTVHWDEPAPVRLFGVQVTLEIVVGGLTVICALTVLPPRAAVSVRAVGLATVPAEAVNWTFVKPCGT